MANITKPSDINKIWSASGDIISPSDTKITNGWAVEIPPRQWFNWLDNKQDQAIAHMNQHGIAVWDNTTEYQAGTSYVQGSNGNIYKALTTNININPTTDGGTNWSLLAILPRASAAQAQAQTDNNSLITPSLLSLAFQGTNQNKSISGYQKLPGGIIIQWGGGIPNASGNLQQTLPIAFPTSQARGTCSTQGESNPALHTSVFSLTTTNIDCRVRDGAGAASTAQIYWIALGY